MARSKKAADHPSDNPLSERAERLLKSLIERYIEDGQPVGSGLLARESGLELSSATIRNVLAEMEDQGLVRSPHTSAGRVPTDLGYRLFVDRLVKVKPMQSGEVERIRQQLVTGDTPSELLSSASSLLSSFTNMTSLVRAPSRQHNALHAVDFLPLSDNRVLAVIVLSDAEVENRILHTQRSYSREELQRAGEYITNMFAGRDLHGVRQALLEEMKRARQEVNDFMAEIVGLADRLFPEKDKENLVVGGEVNLMRFHEMADTERLRQLFEAFNNKKDILELMDSCLISQGVQLFIGSESGRELFDNLSLVTSPYTIDGEVVGVLGVIGPTRMAYERIIPMVDVTAKLLSAALEFRK